MRREAILLAGRVDDRGRLDERRDSLSGGGAVSSEIFDQPLPMNAEILVVGGAVESGIADEASARFAGDVVDRRVIVELGLDLVRGDRMRHLHRRVNVLEG